MTVRAESESGNTQHSADLFEVKAYSLGPVLDGVDKLIVQATSILLGAIGAAFIILLCAAVLGRYLMDLPLAFIEESSRILLVWFFMLGVGLAFRKKAHVAVEFFVERMPHSIRSACALLANLVGLVFVGHVALGGLYGLEAASRQVEPTLGISGLWAALAIPCGSILLIYHQIRALVERYFGAANDGGGR
jgi:C4-dicarboxylate transporter DctQ subunit